MTVEDKLREIQEAYDEAIEISNQRIDRILNRINELRPLPSVQPDIHAPAFLIDGRHKIGPRLPNYVHIGQVIELRYDFPITARHIYDKIRIDLLGTKRLKEFDFPVNVVSGDRVSVMYTLVPSNYATPENTLHDTVRLV